jgi:hypothetical protein
MLFVSYYADTIADPQNTQASYVQRLCWNVGTLMAQSLPISERQWGRIHIIDNWCASRSRVYPGVKVPQGWRRMPLEFKGKR